MLLTKFGVSRVKWHRGCAQQSDHCRDGRKQRAVHCGTALVNDVFCEGQYQTSLICTSCRNAFLTEVLREILKRGHESVITHEDVKGFLKHLHTSAKYFSASGMNELLLPAVGGFTRGSPAPWRRGLLDRTNIVKLPSRWALRRQTVARLGNVVQAMWTPIICRGWSLALSLFQVLMELDKRPELGPTWEKVGSV